MWGLGSAHGASSPWVRARSGCLGLEGFGRVRGAFVPKVNRFLVAHIHIRIDLQTVMRFFCFLFFGVFFGHGIFLFPSSIFSIPFNYLMAFWHCVPFLLFSLG